MVKYYTHMPQKSTCVLYIQYSTHVLQDCTTHLGTYLAVVWLRSEREPSGHSPCRQSSRGSKIHCLQEGEVEGWGGGVRGREVKGTC